MRFHVYCYHHHRFLIWNNIVNFWKKPNKTKQKLVFQILKKSTKIASRLFFIFQTLQFRLHLPIKITFDSNARKIRLPQSRRNNLKKYFRLSSIVKFNFTTPTRLIFWNNNFKILLFSIFNLKSKLEFSFYYKSLYDTFFGNGFVYVRGLFIIFSLDALITDDEPLWEPIEWSLVQTWIFFIFLFAWIAENLITSRYGSYTGRDKRVWFAWYKSFWFIELWYLLSFASAAAFVITPFYYEITYQVSFIVSWWSWYTRIFFFKLISALSLLALVATFVLLNIRWLNWKKLFALNIVISSTLAFILYFSFISSFWGYFTDPLWYQKTRFNNYIQLSHEPIKWGWGPAKRDHFTYHKVSTVFWFKNDNPFAGAMLLFHLFLFLVLFFLYLYWLVLLRRIYATSEISITYMTYCVSALRQFLYYFLFLFVLIIFSIIINYWRFPLEFLWLLNTNTWLQNFACILSDYWTLFLN